MPRVVEMNDRTPLVAQLDHEFGSVILINEFKVEPVDEELSRRYGATIAPNEVRIRGIASAVNHSDLEIRTGNWPVPGTGGVRRRPRVA
jgi:hypothetical protein